MYSIQIALFDGRFIMLSSSTSVFLFHILLKEFLLKSHIFKALMLKIYIYGNVYNQLCLPFIAAIFDHI